MRYSSLLIAKVLLAGRFITFLITITSKFLYFKIVKLYSLDKSMLYDLHLNILCDIACSCVVCTGEFEAPKMIGRDTISNLNQSNLLRRSDKRWNTWKQNSEKKLFLWSNFSFAGTEISFMTTPLPWPIS